jgi:hypothetical protein
MTRTNQIALLISLLTFAACAWMTQRVYENVPHLEDEIAFVWQARVITQGEYVIETPYCPSCFLEPFVVDYQGLRFGKYPLGWPAALSLGIRLGVRPLVNPFLAGLSVWLVYRLASKVLSSRASLLAAFLTATSPFFLMNSISLLSHTWSLFLTLAFTLAWIDCFIYPSRVPRWLTVVTAAVCLGALALTRPLTAVGVALPFVLHAAWILFKQDWSHKRWLFLFVALTAPIAALELVWQAAVTGSPWLNPYSLWWPYDRIGFGPGVGLNPGGHNLFYAYVNAKFSLWVGNSDLFGWPYLSGIFLPLGCIALYRHKPAWLITGVLPALVGAYLFYWIGSWLFGPRYYFEGLFSAAILTAAGIEWLLVKLRKAWPGVRLGRLRFPSPPATITAALVFLLLLGNLLFYLPARIGGMNKLYGASREQLTPFITAQAQGGITPALVIVHPQQHWMEYGGLLELSDPQLTSPWIFTYSRGSQVDDTLGAFFPGRAVYHYYPDQPDYLYTVPRT